MAKIEGIEQNSPAWIKARIGVITASHMCEVVAKRKDGAEAAAREDYKYEILAEIDSGMASEHLVTKPMQWGISYQQPAMKVYELTTGHSCQPGGFWRHDTVKWFGASPDYLVGNDGLVEIKCPFYSKHHFRCIRRHEIPEDYLWQVRAQLSVTGREWCDFVSFDPRLSEHNQLWVKRVWAKQEASLIRAVEVEVQQFLKEIDQILFDLNGDDYDETYKTAKCIQPADGGRTPRHLG